MTFNKLVSTFNALGIGVRRENSGIAIYIGKQRIWAQSVDEAWRKGLDHLPEY